MPLVSWVRTWWNRIWERDRAQPLPPNEVLKRTYRFLRLAMAMMAFAILVAMVIERRHASGWEESISAYYYTAARPIFTGALITIGVCLISIKGRTEIEDTALNLAGMLAPLVPLIPPNQASITAGSTISPIGFPVSEVQNHELLVNSMLVVVIVAAVSFALMWMIGTMKREKIEFQHHDQVGLVIAAVVTVVGIGSYVWIDFVRENAHGLAALLMFVCLWPAIVANAYSAQETRYRRTYAWIAVLMPALAAAVGVAKLISPDWRHHVLILEIVELSPFVVYWIVQTFEQWNAGIEPAMSTIEMNPPST